MIIITDGYSAPTEPMCLSVSVGSYHQVTAQSTSAAHADPSLTNDAVLHHQHHIVPEHVISCDSCLLLSLDVCICFLCIYACIYIYIRLWLYLCLCLIVTLYLPCSDSCLLLSQAATEDIDRSALDADQQMTRKYVCLCLCLCLCLCVSIHLCFCLCLIVPL